MAWNKLGKAFRGYYNVDDVGVFGANAIDYTLTTDQGAKFQACIDQIAALGGGTIFIGGRFYVNQEITLPNTAYVRLLGSGSGPQYQTSPSAIIWMSDLGAGKYGLKLNTGGYPYHVSHLTIAGPAADLTLPWGKFPSAMYGVFCPTRGLMDSCRVYGWGAGIGVINDHQKWKDCDLQGNGYAMDWMDNPLGGLGDQVVEHSFLTNCLRASIGIAPTASIANARFTQNGHCGFSPFGVHRYYSQAGVSVAATGSAASATITGVAISDFVPLIGVPVTGTNIPANTTVTAIPVATVGSYSLTLSNTPTGAVTAVAVSFPRSTVIVGVTFENWSWEGCHHSIMYDEPALAGLANQFTGQWSSMTFDHLAESSTFGWFKWEQVGVAATGSGASATLTGVAVTNFRPTSNMIVTGTNIPAGAKIASGGVSGTSGNWSLTLTATPTGAVSTVTVGMALDMGAYEVGACGGWNVDGAPQAYFNTRPWMSADSITAMRITSGSNFLNGFHDNPGSRPFRLRGSYGAFNSRVAGVFIGPPRGSGSLAMSAAVADEALAKWDVLESHNTSNCQKHRGAATSQELGIALDDFVQGDVAVFAWEGNSSFIHVKNKTGASIAQNAIVTPDAANPGCVKTWTAPADGVKLGRLNDTALANNSDAGIWLRVP